MGKGGCHIAGCDDRILVALEILSKGVPKGHDALRFASEYFDMAEKCRAKNTNSAATTISSPGRCSFAMSAESLARDMDYERPGLSKRLAEGTFDPNPEHVNKVDAYYAHEAIANNLEMTQVVLRQSLSFKGWIKALLWGY